jgi:hypothetical protein
MHLGSKNWSESNIKMYFPEDFDNPNNLDPSICHSDLTSSTLFKSHNLSVPSVLLLSTTTISMLEYPWFFTELIQSEIVDDEFFVGITTETSSISKLI